MDYETQQVVLRWWQSMMLPPEQLQKTVLPAPSLYKAQLRRCETIEQAMLTSGFRALWLSLDEQQKKVDASLTQQSEALERWAAIAMLLVQVKKSVPTKLAQAAGMKGDGDKSVVSELRFMQLQSAKTPADFVRRLRRIIQQLKGEVNVPDLAQNIEQWFQEHGQLRPRQADKRISIQWAMDYYRAASDGAK